MSIDGEAVSLPGLTDAELTTAIEDNLIAYINYYNRASESQSLSEPLFEPLFEPSSARHQVAEQIPSRQQNAAASHVTALTGLSQPSLNAIMRIRFSPLRLAEQIAAAMQPFKRQNIPMLWWLFPGTQPAHLGQELEKQQIYYAGTTPGMALDLLHLPQEPLPTGLQITEVSDEESLEEWIRVSARSFDSDGDEESTETHPDYRAFELSLGWEPERPYRRFIGWIGQQAIATAAIFVEAGVVGLYSVSTLPTFRKRGIGRALSLAALQSARKQGSQLGILQASDAGYRIYKRLGFQECCTIQTYVWFPEEQPATSED